MVKYHKKYCKYLNRGEVCKHGCIEVNGKQRIVCHKFARGECKYGSHKCHHGLHTHGCKPQKANPMTTQCRGDGFRPHTTDTAVEITLKKHLATLMLSSKCEDLLDLDSSVGSVAVAARGQAHGVFASAGNLFRPKC